MKEDLKSGPPVLRVSSTMPRQNLKTVGMRGEGVVSEEIVELRLWGRGEVMVLLTALIR